MKKTTFILLFLCFSQVYHAQENTEPIQKPFYIGFGLGMDYGGIGMRMEYMFLDYAGLFTGVGYNFYGLGFNGGVMLKAMPKQVFTPYLTAMYGYTGTIRIVNESQYDRIDYGVSLGGGFEIKTKNQNAWQFGLVHPFRSKGFMNHYQALVDNPSIKFDVPMRPVMFTIGYKMVIR
jgi:hypothetical protein